MKNKFFVLCLVGILTISLLGVSSAQAPSAGDMVKSIQSLAMFKVSKFNEHLRMARCQNFGRE
jgi:hypothetical protein